MYSEESNILLQNMFLHLGQNSQWETNCAWLGPDWNSVKQLHKAHWGVRLWLKAEQGGVNDGAIWAVKPLTGSFSNFKCPFILPAEMQQYDSLVW